MYNNKFLLNVQNYIENGKLIVDLNDKRHYGGFFEKVLNTSDLIDDESYSTGFAASIFTPEQIGKMSMEEYMKNEAEILEPYDKGLIRKETPVVDLSEFTNPISGKKRIFTREDIDKMPIEEFNKYQKEIFAQAKYVGVPFKGEISNNVNTYTKEKQYYSSQNGRWVTIEGNHVFIENG